MTMAIDGPGWTAVLQDMRPGVMPDGRRGYGQAMQSRHCDGEADVREPAHGDRHKRLPVGRVAAEPTVWLFVLEQLPSCLAPERGWCANRCGARKDVEDDHRCAGVPADEGWSRFDDGVFR